MDDKSGFTEQMPQTIGRYQVQESVGYGAMGAVYKAFDPLIKRTLAIKTIRLDIPKQSPQYKSFIERFYHEARISGTLSHPNIVTLFDIGEEGGIPYLAMEFVEGETIASLIDKGVRFPPEKVIGLISQIASAVDYAHSRGVIHRDIKPSNLILFEGERVKVTDFGIAKLVDAEMTQSGTLLGTPSYMSPEQAMGDKLDGRSDIFSLGVCAFEMLSGEQPFPGNNVTSILYKLVHVDPIEPPNLEMHGLVPQRWHEVFGRVLAKKPDDRYQTATEFVQDLEYCLGSWFGAAMDTVADGTVAMPSLTGDGDGESVTRAIPRLDEESADGSTTAMPALGASAPPALVPAPVAARPEAAAAADEESPETVSLQAPSEEAIAAAALSAPPGGGEKTIVMRADQLAAMAKAAPPPPTARVEKPTSGPAEKTVLMKASDLPPAPPKARAAAQAPPAPAEKTVLMASPVGAAQGPAELPTLRPTNELTVKAPPPLSAPTVRSTLPPGSRAVPPLPKQAEPPRPVPPPAVVPAAIAKAPPPPKPLPLPPRPADELDDVPEAPRRAGVSAGLVLGLGGFAAVLVLAAVGVWAYRTVAGPGAPSPAPSASPEVATSTPTPAPVVTPSIEPSPATPVFTGSLHIETQPAGAAVSLNGEARGVTPVDITDLAEDTYVVRLELKGYEAKTQNVTLTPDAPSQEVKVAMQRAGPAMGIADILSTPFGATVTLDGNRLGLTPLTDQKVRVGGHQIELTKEGYEPFSASLRVELGKRARVDALLRAVAKATPAPAPPDKVDPTKVYQPSEIDTQPKRLTGGSAPYPDSAPRMRSGDSVSVSLSFVITEDGEVTDIKVIESGGKMVDEAVMAAVQKWKYAPGIKKGIKVKVRSGAKQTFRAG